MLKTDEYGFQYYSELPQNAKQIKTVWPFVTINPESFNYYDLNVGTKYLIEAKALKRYYIMEISEHSRDRELLKYAERNQIFLLSL